MIRINQNAKRTVTAGLSLDFSCDENLTCYSTGPSTTPDPEILSSSLHIDTTSCFGTERRC